MQLAVGRIGRPHGIGGEVHIDVHTDDPGQRLAAGAVLATEPPDRGPLTVAAARWHSGRLLVGFAEVTDRTAAEVLRGTWLVIDSADVPVPEDPDEFHDAQLIGLAVRTPDGKQVGTVADVLHHGQDLLVVRGRDASASAGSRGTAGAASASGAAGAASASGAADAGEVLVPFVAAIVPEVDVRAGHLIIDPPAGLLEPGEAL
jgi:16S rRNA processing protein RimM